MIERAVLHHQHDDVIYFFEVVGWPTRHKPTGAARATETFIERARPVFAATALLDFAPRAATFLLERGAFVTDFRFVTFFEARAFLDFFGISFLPCVFDRRVASLRI